MTRLEATVPHLKSLAGLDKVIHEPGRLSVVSLLSVVAEADFLYLMDQTGLTRGNLSSHMKKLETAGFVDIDKTFVAKVPRTTYRLTAAGRRAFQTYRRGLLAALGDLPD
jgi:DNA-binding HxlR family transcriptional regulator